MYIKNGSSTELINTNFVHRFCIVDKEDCTLLIASYGHDVQPVTVARYKTHEEAVKALCELQDAMAFVWGNYSVIPNTSERSPLKTAGGRKTVVERYGSRT